MCSIPSCETNKIAVIMPVYNAGKFLTQAIDSILQQSFTDFEFLICDDCSTDGSMEVLQQMAEKDPRIKLFRNKKNSGVTYSLNRLLSEVSAPLIARMDADDIAMPDRLQMQYDFMQQHPEAAVSGGNLEIIDEENRCLGIRYYRQEPEAIRRNILCGSPLAHPAVIMRREAVTDGYITSGGCEDYDLWLRIAAAGGTLTNLPEILLRYRLSANQVKQRNMKASLLSTIKLQRKYLFRKGFFSFKALIYFFAEHVLLLLPNKLVLTIFKRVTYK